MINTVNAALNVFLDPNTPENEIEDRLIEGLLESTKELLRPFFGEAIFSDALLTAALRNGRDSEGKIIKGWDTTEDWLDSGNLTAGIYHVFLSLIPGALDQLDPTGFLKTDNLGSQVWKSLEGDLPDMPVRWAIYHPDDYNSVIVATEVGIWTSNDVSSNSINWTPNSAGGIANVRVDMLRIRKTDKLVAAATRWPITGISKKQICLKIITTCGPSTQTGRKIMKIYCTS